MARTLLKRPGEKRPLPSEDPSSVRPERDDTVPNGLGPVGRFMVENYKHFNALTTLRAAQAHARLVDDGGAMFLSLAGAMSTAELGITLSEMIRRDKIQAISCTGANLEEGLFLLCGQDEYVPLPNFRDFSPKDDMVLRKKGLNRVTDSAIPDRVANRVLDVVMPLWQAADKAGEAKFPHEFLWDALRSGALKEHYQGSPDDCWMIAAMEKGIPVYCPGWEDSTLGNAFASACIRGEIQNVTTMRSGVEYMIHLAAWWASTASTRKMGFQQYGGGIPADFAICVVPMLALELDRADLPMLSVFIQITDSTPSYGSYSGADATEKGSWGKTDENTERFCINSDASAIGPLINYYVLGK